MILRTLILPILLLLAALPARGDEVIAGLSQNRISITAGFDGSEILVFGAIRHGEVVPDAGPLEVIVAIQGPTTPATVWRKERVGGIWVNTDGVRVSTAPSFYAVAASGPLNEVLTSTEDLRHRISVSSAVRAMGLPARVMDAGAFTDALIRLRTEEGLYQQLDETVQIDEETLFRTAIALPANLTEGQYLTRVFLTRDGEVIDRFDTEIEVGKIGLERWLYNLAHDQPFVYGLLALVLALVSGWGASAAFQYFRP